MSTQCRFCGSAIRPNTMFCPSCGQLVVSDVPAAASVLPPPFRGTEAPAPTPGVADVPAPSVMPPTPVPLPGSPLAAAAPAVPPPAAVAPAALALRLPQGVEVPIDRVLVLGRNPAGRAAAHGGEPVEVADPGRSVSRVHLIVRSLGPGAAEAEDAGSGNGTVVQRDGVRHPLVPGEPFGLRAGDRLLLGEVAVEVGTAR